MMQDPPPLRRAGNLNDYKESADNPPPTASLRRSLKWKLQTLKDRSKLLSPKQPSAQLPPPNLTEDAPPLRDVVDTSPAVGDIRVPLLLQQGTPMTKVSLKKHKKFVFRLDADLGQIVWESKQHKISQL